MFKRPAAAAAVGAECRVRFSEPGFGVEWSRLQVVCRTGFRGAGQSHKIPFKNNKADIDRAKREAVAWVAEQRRLQGLD